MRGRRARRAGAAGVAAVLSCAVAGPADASAFTSSASVAAAFSTLQVAAAPVHDASCGLSLLVGFTPRFRWSASTTPGVTYTLEVTGTTGSVGYEALTDPTARHEAVHPALVYGQVRYRLRTDLGPQLLAAPPETRWRAYSSTITFTFAAAGCSIQISP